MNTKTAKDWNDVRLGDIADVYSGFAFKSEDQTTSSIEGIPIIKIANINKKIVSKHSVNYFPKTLFSDKHNKYVLKKDDVLVAMTGAGSVGKIGKMMDVDGTYLVNQRVAIVRIDGSLADPEYIYQALTESKYEEYLYNLGLGAGQPNISPDDIKSLLILSPDIQVQHNISSILATYDCLIENNILRIKILEELLSASYNEWFVSKNSAQNIERTGTLGDIAQLVKKKYEDKTDRKLPLIDMARIRSKSLSVSECGTSTDLTTSRIIFNTGDILFGSIRTYLHKVLLAPFSGITNTSVLVFRPISKEFHAFLTAILFRDETIKWTTQYSAGTKMPVIKGALFMTMQIPIPKKDKIEQFENKMNPILLALTNLNIRNLKLKEMRDLLIPKLVTGKIKV